jgi:hypothetical protein
MRESLQEFQESSRHKAVDSAPGQRGCNKQPEISEVLG